MKSLFLVRFLLFVSLPSLFAQPVRLKLPRQINVPNYNAYAPSLTADGLTMIYATDYYVNEGNSVDLKISYAKGLDNWSSGEDVDVVNKSGKLNLYGAHCISADGKKIYFTSRKTGGVGGFDIWVTEKKGSVWSPPQNLGKPVNSEGSDGFPSLSADGRYLYFLRCGAMENSGCANCKMYVSEGKGQEIWKAAKEIPLNGHVLAPKVSKDGNTLIFGSNKPGGKGGYDLYQIKKEGEGWSAPKSLDFLNTSSDEVYADIPSQGEAIIYAAKSDGFYALYRAKLPESFHPEKVLVITSKIPVVPGAAPAGFIQISDNKTGAPVSITKIGNDGKISVTLPAGRSYDVAVTGGSEKFYWSATYDATNLDRTIKDTPEITLDPLEKGKIYYGNKPVFDSTSYQTLPGTSLECKRLSKIFQQNPEWKAELYLFPSGVSNTPPADGDAAFTKMKESFQAELSKSGISQERVNFINGFRKPEEENSYSGWGVKFN